MCDQQEIGSAEQALELLQAALGYLGSVEAASLPAVTQAEVLKGLERAEARHTAARARVLSAFTAQAGYEDDGLGGARTWLTWHTRVTRGAAAGAVGWMRRLAAHPVIDAALAGGELSASWARQFCDWTDRLPADCRDDADRILVAAAARGADLRDIAGLAEEMFQRTRQPDTDGDDGFDDRYFRLGVTFRGAGRADGDLTSGCAAALGAVLDALGKKAGPEDTRTTGQRHHDALEETCRRLIASGMLPGRAGQPTQIQVHMDLRDLLDQAAGTSAGSPPGDEGQPVASNSPTAAADDPADDTTWARAAATAALRAAHTGWLTGPEAGAATCDATIVPVVTGHLDSAALAELADFFLASHHRPSAAPLSPHSRARLERALLALATRTLSGPAGLAAALRARHGGPLATPSLPLDTGTPTPVIPPHLRRALGIRHNRCAFPGCGQRFSVCDIHHVTPRSRGGPTALHNLAPLCRFHHLIVIHQWGWQLQLNPDGTTTATSPTGRVLHSHSPPALAG